MADDLVFPPPDPLSFIDDFDSTLLPNENTLNSINSSLEADLNPSILQSDLLHIPPLVPTNTLSPTEQKISINSITNRKLNINSPLSESYAPISQLMKQTEQLSKTLESPLTSQDMVFRTLNNQTSKNLVNNNAGGFNQLGSSSTQRLVIGGNQQIQIPSPSSLPIQNNLLTLEQQQQALLKQQLLQQQIQLHQQRISVPPLQKSPLQSNIPQIHNIGSPQSGNMSPINVSIPQNLNLQNSVTMKSQSNQDSSKTSLKGQFVKTSDQRLMFVTEVDGRRVAYFIQHSSNSSVAPTQTTLFNSTPSMFMSTNSVHTNNVPVNNPLLTGSSTSTINTVQTKPLIMKQTTEQAVISTIKAEEIVKKPEIVKSIRDKFLDFRNNVISNKTPQLIAQKPASSMTVFHEEKHEDAILNNTDNIKIENENEKPNVAKNHQEIIEDDEDGQEIEFSENDISLNTDLNNIESPLIENNTPLTNQQSTDDEESVPLSFLKSDNADELSTTAHQIIKEELQVNTSAKDTKSVKKQRTLSNDTLPLSVVAASLKKNEEQTKKKGKKGKKKKKDKREPPRPLLAYQVFFRDVQSTLRVENPELTFGELSKLIAQMWEKLEDDKKKLYQDEYHQKKAQYDIQMKEFKELLAKEALESPLPISPSEETSGKNENGNVIGSPSSQDIEMQDSDALVTTKNDLNDYEAVQNNTTSKKPAKKVTRKKATKKTPARAPKNEAKDKKETPTLESMEQMDVDETSNDVPPSPKEVPSSPSLPSSDSSSEESDEDETISRMKRKAEELKKKIKIEKKAVSKSKASKESKKTPRVTRMEVETISKTETILVESKEKPKNNPIKENEPSLLPNQSLSTSSKSQKSDAVTKSSKSDSSLSLSKLRTLRLKTNLPTPDPPSQSDSSDPLNVPPTKVKKVEGFSPPESTASLPKSTFKIPKKSSSGSNPSAPTGPRLCIRNSCNNPAKSTRERGGQYCSNECLVLYCREQFDSWVLDRTNEDENT